MEDPMSCKSCLKTCSPSTPDRLCTVCSTQIDESQLQMPEHVFLKLSIKDECLGVVNIKPWYHLRRARQFSALCLGTFGVSYLGSSFKYVMNKGLSREYLVGGGYLSSSGQRLTYRDLMTNLEWGEEASGEGREGLVIGVGDVKNGIFPEEGQSGFAICTRDARGINFQCPIGEVVSGLDVVKKAAKHDPVQEVMITRCGALVPEQGLD